MLPNVSVTDVGAFGQAETLTIMRLPDVTGETAATFNAVALDVRPEAFCTSKGVAPETDELEAQTRASEKIRWMRTRAWRTTIPERSGRSLARLDRLHNDHPA